MRNISQTIFNIDKMEKIIKTLPELKSIIDANKFHTFDYTEGVSFQLLYTQYPQGFISVIAKPYKTIQS